jgi:hypothetical protein
MWRKHIRKQVSTVPHVVPELWKRSSDQIDRRESK